MLFRADVVKVASALQWLWVGSNRSQPIEVLNRRNDFLRLKVKGRRVRVDFLLFNYLGSESPKIGWTLKKKVGSAVVRNKLKRWCRHSVRQQAVDERTPQADINIIFRNEDKDFYKRLPYSEFDRCFRKGCEIIRKRL